MTTHTANREPQSMRAVVMFSLWMAVGAVAGVSLPMRSLAATPQSGEAVPASSNGGAAPSAESVTTRIAKLVKEVPPISRSGLEILIRSRQLQAERPRFKADEDDAARAQRQQALVQWVSNVDEMRSELQNHKAQVNEIKAAIREIRNLDMNDSDVEALVELELGVHNLSGIMRNGTRKLASARRRGVNALDTPLDTPLRDALGTPGGNRANN